MRSVPLGSWLVLFAEVLATGGPVNLLPPHCCESIDLATTTWLLAAVMRNSNEVDQPDEGAPLGYGIRDDHHRAARHGIDGRCNDNRRCGLKPALIAVWRCT